MRHDAPIVITDLEKQMEQIRIDISVAVVGAWLCHVSTQVDEALPVYATTSAPVILPAFESAPL